MRTALVALLLLGCGADSETEAPPPRPSGDTERHDPEVRPVEAPEPVQVPEASSADADEPLSAEARREVRAALRAGRSATRAGRTTVAMRHFDRALELNPRSASTHCEAGFAALESAEHLDYAERHLELGLALHGDAPPPEPLRAPLAMCLYNRGLLAERRERFGSAVDFFERSLALRETTAVRRRLAAARRGRPVPVDVVRARSLDALAERLAAELAEDYEDLPQYEFTEVSVGFRFPADGDRPEVGALSEIADSIGNWGNITNRVFAVRTDGGYWTASRFEGRRSPNEDAEWNVSSAELLAPGWLRLDYTLEDSRRSSHEIEPPSDADEDESIYCDYEDSESRRSAVLLLCHLTSTMRCAALHTRAGSERTRAVECSDEVVPSWAAAYGESDEDEPEAGFEMRVETHPERGIRVALIRGDPSEHRYVLPVDRWVPFEDAFDLGEER